MQGRIQNPIKNTLDGQLGYVFLDHFALDHWLILIKLHRIIELKQQFWLRPYIDIKTDLRAKAKNDFEKHLSKLKKKSGF